MSSLAIIFKIQIFDAIYSTQVLGYNNSNANAETKK